ncbi:MAG: hypothetical protein AAF771_07715 [Pseudomonadota bacterium]
MRDWDFESQQRDTAWVIDDVSKTQGISIGAPITLEVQTVDGGQGSRAEYVATLETRQLKHSFFGGDEDDPETITVVFPDTLFELSSIWQRERLVTEVALQFGYVPDGWGFWEPGS